jgi:hypothetical protein
MDKKIIRSRTLKVDIQRNGLKDNQKMSTFNVRLLIIFLSIVLYVHLQCTASDYLLVNCVVCPPSMYKKIIRSRTLKVDIQHNGQKDNQKSYIVGGHTTQWTKR